MKVQIPYGPQEKVAFHVPDKYFYGMLEPEDVAPVENAEQAIAHAIEHPLGSPALEAIVGFDRRVNIICDDISRPTPCHLILPVLIKKLHKIGVSDENIKIVMALGSHRYMSEAEMRQKVGNAIFEKYKVVNSEFKRDSDLVDLGTTPDGVRIFVTREAMDCDIRIGIGNVVPHPVMGWSGGGKILFPGVTGESTVAQFHMMGGMADENLFGRENCHVRLSMESWVDTIGLHFIINTVLTPKFEIYKVAAGHYIDAQRECVRHAKRALGCKMDKKADVIIVSSFPADADFWQSAKGFCSAELGLKDENSTMILVSPNFEGIGPHKEYLDFFGMDNAEEHLLRLFNGEKPDGDPLALSVGTSMSKLRRRKKLILVTDGMTREETEACRIQYYPLEALQQAVDEALAKYENPVVAAACHGGELYIYQEVNP